MNSGADSSFILHPSSLLVFRLSALGDVVHTIPAVVALRVTHQITWVVEAPYRELVEIVAGVETIPVSTKHWWRHPGELAQARRAMRGFDAAIDFQGLVKSAVLMRLSGAPLRIGFDRHAIREKLALLFTNCRVAVDRERHVVEWNLQLAGVTMPPVDFAPFAQGDVTAEGRIVLLPGAGKRSKQWPIERFRELAMSVGDRALAAWGPNERPLAEQIGCEIAPPTNLRQLAKILQTADLVVGADTGPLHLAAALGTPVIGLYGPTNPRRNGPYGQTDRRLGRFGDPMNAISVHDVMMQINPR